MDTTWFDSIGPVARLCQDSYNSVKHLTGGPLSIRSAVPLREDQASTYCVVYISDAVLYIVFRGSAEVTDWTSNGQVIKREFAGIRMHRGFARATEEVLPAIAHVVDNYPNHQIVLAGHSRGGAIAAAMAAALRLHFRKSGVLRKTHVITFGQPRLSRQREIDLAIYGDYIRVQNSSDMVPRVPKMGYSHGGTNIYLTRKNKLEVDPSGFGKFWDRTPTLWSRGTTHFMSNYIRAWNEAYMDYLENSA